MGLQETEMAFIQPQEVSEDLKRSVFCRKVGAEANRGERRTQASGLHYMHFMPHSDGDGAGRRVAGEGRKAT